MSTTLRPTQFEGETKEYAFRLGYSPRKGDVPKWALIRWPLGGPKIPPCGQILTEDGWQGLLATTSPTKHIFLDDVEHYF